MVREGAGFAGFAAGHLGQGPHDTDIMSIPDLSSLTVVPWRSNMAWLAGNLHVDGEPWPYCPRTILQRQLAKATEQGYVLNVGVEPEFMLLKQNDSGQFVPWDVHDRLEKPCYDLRALHRNLDLMTELIGYMQGMGWAPYANDHEDANCQFEINWSYADSLTTADRNTFFKWMVRTIAERHGLWATFMPKPFANLTGNGTHYHMSLADAKSGKNLFLDDSDDLGLSQLARWFHGRHPSPRQGPGRRDGADRQQLQAPHPRRPEFGRNLGAGVRDLWPLEPHTNDPRPRPRPHRKPHGRRRVEPLPGLRRDAGGGPRRHPKPDRPRHEKQRQPLSIIRGPNSTSAASPSYQRPYPKPLDCLEQDDVVKGALGEAYAPYYIQVKRDEWADYHQSISQWETDNYLLVH